MLKNIILEHKSEKEKVLSKNYIWREKLDFADKFIGNELIKIIIGPRRAGKSIFSFLLLKNKKFAYLNFDDESFMKLDNYDEIIKGIFEVYPESKVIFFDEIQNLNNWELFVNKLQRRGYNLVLTGSNAQLLNKELASALTGRYILLQVFPFSFNEFLTAKNFKIDKDSIMLPEAKGTILNYLDDYLRNGGFPEIVVKGMDTKVYLETLFDALLFKDVVKRYRVRFPQRIYDLAVYLISHYCSEFSFTKLRRVLEFRSTNTVEIYLKYLEEAYLFFSLNRFSFKIKEQLRAPKKMYIVDNGFIMAKSFQFSGNIGRLMENLTLVENLRRGYKLNESIFYYKTKNGREVDFVLREKLKVKRLIQVCYEINDEDTKERELKALIEAGNELNCEELLIITWDTEKREEFKNKEINFLPLWKWLLNV